MRDFGTGTRLGRAVKVWRSCGNFAAGARGADGGRGAHARESADKGACSSLHVSEAIVQCTHLGRWLVWMLRWNEGCVLSSNES